MMEEPGTRSGPGATHRGRSARVGWIALLVSLVVILPLLFVLYEAHVDSAPAGTYSVTFSQSGAPVGMPWSVTLNATTHSSNGAEVSFVEPNGIYSFTIHSSASYRAVQDSGTVVIRGASLRQAVAFVSAAPNTYPVTFLAQGFLNDSSWSVSLDGVVENSTSPTIAFAEPNGTYEFTARAVDQNLSAHPSSGWVNVSGAPENLTVDFTRSPIEQYNVTFEQTTLPAGATWYMSVGPFTSLEFGEVAEFQLPNGTYPFAVTPVPGYIATPGSGSVTVRGAPVSVTVVFTPAPEYPLTFSESGLPAGTVWYVTLGYSSTPSSNSTHTYLLSNATYDYLISTVDIAGVQWNATPSSGAAVINGSGVNVSVVFAPGGEFDLVFSEAGLPVQTVWNLTLTFHGDLSAEESTNAVSMFFTYPNGTYGFTVGGVPGYTASPSAGNVTIDGAPVNQTIEFTPDGPSGPPSGSPRTVNSETGFEPTVSMEMGTAPSSGMVART
jgi:hypothetical protein